MRRFTYLNNQWAVNFTGISSSVNSANMTSFSVIFTSISDPTLGLCSGSIHHGNLDDETDDNLRKSLEMVILRSARSVH